MDTRVGRPIVATAVDGTELHAPVVDENEVRAAAGLTMVIGAVAFSYAYFTRQYIPLQVVASLFFVEFLIRVTVGIRYSPIGALARALTFEPAAGVGLRQTQTVRVDARAGHDLRDDDHHQHRDPRHAAPDDLPDLPDADVDGVGARPVPGLQDPRPDGATGLDARGPRIRGLRRRRLRAARTNTVRIRSPDRQTRLRGASLGPLVIYSGRPVTKPASEPGEACPTGDRDRRHHRRAGRRELEEALLDGDPHHVGDDHWKISASESPSSPCPSRSSPAPARERPA